MKTIVISGAKSNVGKTTLAEKVSGLLPGSVCVKLGHGELKEGVNNVFYHAGTPFATIVEENTDAEFLIIESNRVLEEIDPDLVIYLPANDPKPSAGLAENRAHLIRGNCDGDMVTRISEKLGVDDVTAAEIVRLACDAGDGSEDGE